MFSRKQEEVNEASLPLAVKRAREILAARGWTYRPAAEALGVSLTHLSWVLTARRESRRLLLAIEGIPLRSEWEKKAKIKTL